MLKVFCAPARYTQGPDATRQLGSEIKNLGLEGPILILAGGSAVRLLEKIWADTFAQAGLSYTVLPFSGECTVAEIQQGREAAVAIKARLILGAGGGKVLDAARAIAAELELPVVNCPTVASSDAACSAVSVIYSPEGLVEEYRFFRRNPDLVLVDTTLIARSPARLLIAGMGDALATWFEAKVCAEGGVKNLRGGASTRSALALAELCYKTLLADGLGALQALRQQQVNESLERLVEANTLLSGLGFESAGLAAAHAVHNGLTTAPGAQRYLHGEKVAFGVITQLLLEDQPEAIVQEVLGFSKSVGLPITFAEIGIPNPTASLLETIALRTTVAGETIHHEPFPVTAQTVVAALRAADAAGAALHRAQAI